MVYILLLLLICSNFYLILDIVTMLLNAGFCFLSLKSRRFFSGRQLSYLWISLIFLKLVLKLC